MNLFDKFKPVFSIDDEMNELLVNIDSKLNDIKIKDKQKENIWLQNQKLDQFILHLQ